MEAEISIKTLLERIKKEGIEEAERQAEALLEKARSDAAAIVRDARKEAEEIVSRAEQEAQRTRAATEREIALAGRDLILGVRARLVSLLDETLHKEAREALTPRLIQELISNIAEKWHPTGEFQGIEVLLSEQEARRLEEAGFQALQERLRGGVTLRPVDGIEAGFRIGEKGGAVHYDITDRGIAEILGDYLRPRLSKFLAAAADPGKEKADG